MQQSDSCSSCTARPSGRLKTKTCASPCLRTKLAALSQSFQVVNTKMSEIASRLQCHLENKGQVLAMLFWKMCDTGEHLLEVESGSRPMFLSAHLSNSNGHGGSQSLTVDYYYS